MCTKNISVSKYTFVSCASVENFLVVNTTLLQHQPDISKCLHIYQNDIIYLISHVCLCMWENIHTLWRMGKYKNLSGFDKGQIVIANDWVTTAGLVGCTQHVIISTLRKWSGKGQLWKPQLPHVYSRVTDAHGKWRLGHLV